MSRRRASGFVLLPVMLTLAMLAVVTALLLERSGTGGSVAAAQQASAALGYAAEAGHQHARALLGTAGCLTAMSLPDTPLGSHTYSAVMPPTGTTVPAQSFQLTAVADSWLNESDEDDTNGSDSVLKNKREGGKDERSILRFNLSAVPSDFDVASATLRLYVKSKDDSGAPVQIYRVTDSWGESWADWDNTAGDHDSAFVHGSFVPNQDGFLSTDLTPLVRQWVAGKAPNYGILFKSTSWNKESQYASREDSSTIRPRLDIVGRPNALYAISAVGRDAGGLARTLARTVQGPAASALFLDYFDAGYAGNDGTQNFGGDWQETGESNGPGSGAVQVISHSDCALGNCLRIDASMLSSAGTWRELALAGASSAVLSLHRKQPGGGNYVLEVSGNGGASWQTLMSYSGSSGSQQRDSFDISAYASANTRIRVRSTALVFGGKMYVDDVEVEASCGP